MAEQAIRGRIAAEPPEQQARTIEFALRLMQATDEQLDEFERRLRAEGLHPDHQK